MMEQYVNKIFNEDCLEFAKRLPDNCIDLIITSPPYDNMRDYKRYSFDFENISKQLFRITKKGGILVWIVGDATLDGSETGTSFKQALYFKEIGFNLHDTMIYMKNGTTFPNEKRYHQCFEYMFILSKGTPSTVNLIKDRPNSQSNKIHKNRWERQKNGDIKFRDKEQYKILDIGSRWNIWIYEVGWQKTTADTFAYQHPAMFPELLAQDHILSWSNANDIVYDPFAGSGTVAKMCLVNNRKYIGTEISKQYFDIATERIKTAQAQGRLDL